jgi:predicted nucleotidyltransferase
MNKTVFPNLIKQARLNAGLTQASASEYLGISKRTIGSWEDGSRTPSTGVLLAIAEKILAYPKKREAVYSTKEGIYSLSEIISIVRRVVQTEDVSRVVLFGSYAKGLAKATSDVDLYVETPLIGFAFFGLAEKLKNALKKEVDAIGSKEVIPDGKVDREIKNTGIVIYERCGKTGKDSTEL